jgi:hypothetical protein
MTAYKNVEIYNTVSKQIRHRMPQNLLGLGLPPSLLVLSCMHALTITVGQDIIGWNIKLTEYTVKRP